jgi:hypothetical protein
VSTPVTWKEVEQCLAKGDPELLVFTADQVLKRAEKMGDLFAPVLTLKQKLPALESLGQATPESATSEPPAPVRASSKAPKKKKSMRSAKPAKKAVAKSPRRVAKSR